MDARARFVGVILNKMIDDEVYHYECGKVFNQTFNMLSTRIANGTFNYEFFINDEIFDCIRGVTFNAVERDDIELLKSISESIIYTNFGWNKIKENKYFLSDIIKQAKGPHKLEIFNLVFPLYITSLFADHMADIPTPISFEQMPELFNDRESVPYEVSQLYTDIIANDQIEIADRLEELVPGLIVKGFSDLSRFNDDYIMTPIKNGSLSRLQRVIERYNYYFPNDHFKFKDDHINQAIYNNQLDILIYMKQQGIDVRPTIDITEINPDYYHTYNTEIIAWLVENNTIDFSTKIGHEIALYFMSVAMRSQTPAYDQVRILSDAMNSYENNI